MFQVETVSDLGLWLLLDLSIGGLWGLDQNREAIRPHRNYLYGIWGGM